jgi:predicted alpha/beta superfamily hydrolase
MVTSHVQSIGIRGYERLYEVTNMKLTLDDYQVTITPSVQPTDVIVYCNSYGDGTDSILESCRKMDCPAFHLVVVSKIHWDADMSPWPADKIISKSDHFTGNADQYLDWMLTRLIPHCEQTLQEKTPRRILLGYSMSGLFSLYAMYRTNQFSVHVSASGSVWYPDFVDFAMSHSPLVAFPVYLSIGDRESISKNKYLKTTIDKTRQLTEYYQSQGHICHFDLNPGNHFVDADLRQAKGIKWAMERICV